MKLWPLALIGLFALSGTASASPDFQPTEPRVGDRDILKYLLGVAEQTSGISGAADFLEAVARRESRFNPSAKNESASESAAARRLFLSAVNQRRYAANPYIGDPDRWAYSGGWFGFMPASALSVRDKSAATNDPQTVFSPEYAVAYAVDYIVDMIRSYHAKNWGEVRVGWAAPSLVDNPEHKRYGETIGRLRTDLKNTGTPSSFADRAVPSTRNYPGFQVVLNSLLNSRSS